MHQIEHAFHRNVHIFFLANSSEADHSLKSIWQYKAMSIKTQKAHTYIIINKGPNLYSQRNNAARSPETLTSFAKCTSKINSLIYFNRHQNSATFPH